jgi:hypothetical protein
MVMNMITLQAPGTNHDTVWSRGASVFLIVDSTPRSILGAGVNIVYASPIANGAYARIDGVLNGTSGALRENGIVRVSGDVGTVSGGILTLGSLNAATAHSTNVEIVEALEVTGTVSPSTLKKIVNYQKRTWGLAA